MYIHMYIHIYISSNFFNQMRKGEQPKTGTAHKSDTIHFRLNY